MKHYIYIAFFFIFFSFFSTAQNVNRVNISVKNTVLPDILDDISRQTGIRFSYNSQLIEPSSALSFHFKDAPIDEVLSKILPSSVTYKHKGNYIILSQREENYQGRESTSYSAPTKENNPSNKDIEKKEEDNYLINNNLYIDLEKISIPHNGIRIEDCHSTVNIKNEEKMKQYLAAILLAAVSMTNQAAAQQNEENGSNQINQTNSPQNSGIKEHKAGIITLVYPLSTDWVNSINNSYNASFSMIGGITGQTNGFELSSAFNMNRYSSSGMQISGGFNLAGFTSNTTLESKNVQISGAFNFTKKGYSSQITGGVNVADKGAIQISGGVNVADSSSCQITGGVNVTDKGAVQISGGANIAKKSDAQITGVINRSKSSGIQISGGVNVADSSSCQITGVVNVTKKGGFQLGVVNVRDTADGVSLGVINIVKRGGVMEFGVEGGEFIHSSLTFRSGVNALYTILSVGANYSDEFIAVGAGLGSSIGLSQKFRLNMELMHYGIYNEPIGYGNIGLVQFRPVVNFQAAKHFKVFLGPTFNLLFQSQYNSPDAFIKSPYKMWRKEDRNHFDFWIGFTGGFKF